ncbi:MAG: ribose-phosphate diphosphokinase [Candidatus Micrarchaeia archaeon]
MIVVGDDFGKLVSQRLACEFLKVEDRVFGDGEVCPRVVLDEAGNNALKEQDCVLVLQMKSGENPNSYLVKVIFVVDVIRRLEPKTLAVAMPYLIYARQHKQYLQGQPVSTEIVAKFLENAGANRFVTVNSHSRGDLPGFFSGKVFDLDATSFLANYFLSKKDFDKEKVIAVGPDKGAISLAKHFIDKLGFGQWTAFDKQRDVRTGEITMKKPDGVKFEGKTAIVVDDLCASGGTMIKALNACKEKGAKKAVACFVHPVLNNNALDGLQLVADEIVSTNSIDSSVSVVDLSSLVASAFQDQQQLDHYLVDFD